MSYLMKLRRNKKSKGKNKVGIVFITKKWIKKDYHYYVIINGEKNIYKFFWKNKYFFIFNNKI